MVNNIFIILDDDLLVNVGGLVRFDHPYGYFEEKTLSDFEPVRAYRNMLRESQIIEHALVDVSDIGYLIIDPQENLILGQYIHFHMDIYKYHGMWTYFEDADFYPESTELPPPVNNSDEELVAPSVQFHALDEVNNDEAEEDDEEEEEDPSEGSDSD
ncbi:hypothetical protein Lal_00043368 [Lupinus albus]|nr:hypothetical protein Lal_00043368 [Lupinus albus]